ncbi:phytase [Amycolatopsis sp. FBCC-B4732]|nr:phytase [Amycolatopsis sp. FBCC-B4732]UOX93337.1 phytase [Amycolatopsis sp. FBCC-B4732]
MAQTQAFVDDPSASPANADADDPAIWVHPHDPSRSVVLGRSRRAGSPRSTGRAHAAARPGRAGRADRQRRRRRGPRRRQRPGAGTSSGCTGSIRGAPPPERASCGTSPSRTPRGCSRGPLWTNSGPRTASRRRATRAPASGGWR